MLPFPLMPHAHSSDMPDRRQVEDRHLLREAGACLLSLPQSNACRMVSEIVKEIVMLTGDRTPQRSDRRRMLCHVRQIAMYVCHVSLSIPLKVIGQAFGRDRTTVGHACHVVEDRRDDAAFDDFVSSIERIVSAVFARPE